MVDFQVVHSVVMEFLSFVSSAGGTRPVSCSARFVRPSFGDDPVLMGWVIPPGEKTCHRWMDLDGWTWMMILKRATRWDYVHPWITSKVLIKCCVRCFFPTSDNLFRVVVLNHARVLFGSLRYSSKCWNSSPKHGWIIREAWSTSLTGIDSEKET